MHLTGMATSSDTIKDDLLGIQSSQTLILQRQVDMYQWVESQDIDRSTGDYTYDAEWEASWQDSSEFVEDFHPTNPSQMEYGSQTFAANVTLGSYQLSSEVVNRLRNWYEPYPQALSVSEIPDEDLRKRTTIQDGVVYIYGKDNDYTHDPAQKPQIGDFKVTIGVVVPQTISVIALLDGGSTLVPFPSEEYGHKIWVQKGTKTAAEMLRKACREEQRHLLAIRLFCAGLLYLGFLVLYQPLSVLCNAVPMVEKVIGPTMLRAGVHFVPISLLLTSTLVALCWISVHTLLSLFWLILEGAAVYLVGRHLGWWNAAAPASRYQMVGKEDEQVSMELEEVV